MKPSPPKSIRRVKAWAVTDGKNILNIATRIESGVFKGLYMVGTEKEYMDAQWSPFKVIPCTISFVIPSKKRLSKRV